MECPLPIDWLDWLEQPSDPRLTEHLEGCRSCQILVSLLRCNELELPALEPPAATAPIAFETPATRPAEGEVWVTAPANADGDRAVVLVLDEQHHEFGRDWYEVAAADTAVERATEL